MRNPDREDDRQHLLILLVVALALILTYALTR